MSDQRVRERVTHRDDTHQKTVFRKCIYRAMDGSDWMGNPWQFHRTGKVYNVWFYF